jgi:hypothetical protein
MIDSDVSHLSKIKLPTFSVRKIFRNSIARRVIFKVRIVSFLFL